MLTRRKMLIGTAAGSIAAIATDHGVAAATGDSDGGFLNNACSVGNLERGALGSFHKAPSAFSVFIKWHGSGAEAFYKERLSGGVDFFIKFFNKGWSPVSSRFLEEPANLENAEASFLKLHPGGAEFFIKWTNPGGDEINVFTTFDSNGDFDVSVEQPD